MEDTNSSVLNEVSEPTESEDDLSAIDPNILGQAVVFGTDWTAATLIDQLRRGNIKLDPIFQRRDARNAERKSRFIESIVLGLPIPQIVLAEEKNESRIVPRYRRQATASQPATIRWDQHRFGARPNESQVPKRTQLQNLRRPQERLAVAQPSECV